LILRKGQQATNCVLKGQVKNNTMRNIHRLLLLLLLTTLTFISCKKDSDDTTPTNHTIQGLWVGTYTVPGGGPVPAGTQFYYSFSIYPDGTASYKSKGYYNGSSDYITFANGTWTLTGTQFNYTVTTINIPGGGAQQTQSGSATFNSSTGTLTNGVFVGNTATWTMTKVL
jgi:hypothetical protein